MNKTFSPFNRCNGCNNSISVKNITGFCGACERRRVEQRTEDILSDVAEYWYELKNRVETLEIKIERLIVAMRCAGEADKQ